MLKKVIKEEKFFYDVEHNPYGNTRGFYKRVMLSKTNIIWMKPGRSDYVEIKTKMSSSFNFVKSLEEEYQKQKLLK